MFPLGFDFFALPPEVNSARLSAGPGPAPMLAAGLAYAGAASALATAAGGSDGSMGQLSLVWRGPSAERAHQAFHNHANWLRNQALVADGAAAIANTVAEANATALAMMPPLPLIVANRVAQAVLVATDVNGVNTPELAVNEAVYMGMYVTAAAAMTQYAGQASAALTTLPPPLAAPQIVSGGGGTTPGGDFGGGGPGFASGVSKSAHPGGGPTGSLPGNGQGGSGTGGSGSGQSGSNPGSGTGQQGSGPTDPGQPGAGTGQSGGGQPTPGTGQDTGGGSDSNPMTPQSISPIQDGSTDSNGLGGANGGAGGQDSGFYGTSPYSPTLAGLNGGIGSSVAMSLFRGGIGDMPGASTGFRMPANWGAATRAFGAGVGEPAMAGAPARTVSRSASAPTSQLRKRREQDRKSSKVFVPGEPQDVPDLEAPPAIGVIEYADDEREEESASESVIAGILDTGHDDADSNFEPTISQRPR